MLVTLAERFEIRSNREAGFGRYDIMMRPRNMEDPGVILEFKTFEGDDPQSALESGMAQIQGRDDAAELRDAGVRRIHQMVIAFNGKQVHVILV